MSSRIVTALLLTSLSAAVVLPAGAQTTKRPSELYAEAVNAYFAKDYNKADSVFTGLIENGSEDPRVYFFRGLGRFAIGNIDAAEIDFEAGANLEATGLARVNIPRSLERVQGPARRSLESYRRKAKLDSELTAAVHRKSRALHKLYAAGRAAFLSGKSQYAVGQFDQAIDNGTGDPRVFYFRGLAKQDLGLSEEAVADFQQAIELELNPGNRINVDLALEAVQGELRKALENHRHEAIIAARMAGDKERREMIAAMVEKRIAAGIGSTPGRPIAKSAINVPPDATTPSATPSVGTPATPSTSTHSTTAPPAAASSGSAINTAWLPLEAEVIVNVRVFDLWSSPMLAQLKESPDVQGGLQMMQDEFSLAPRDIETVTAGLLGATELAMAGAADPTALATGTDQIVIVVRTRLPFDHQTIERRTDEFEVASHDGNSFYRSLAPGDIPCVFLPDSKTIVLAEEGPLQAVIEQGAEDSSRPEFEFVDATAHVSIGFVPNDPFALTEQIPSEGTGSDAMDKLASAAKEQLLGVGLGVSLTDSVELEVRLLCIDDAAATDINAALTAVMTELKGMWALMKGAAPPVISGMVDSLIRAQRNSSTREVASISTRITQQSIQNAVENAAEMLPMLMMGALGGGGAIPGGGLGSGTGGDGPPPPPPATKPAEGLTVTPSARPSSQDDLDDEGNVLPKAVELVLDIVGDQAKNATGAGFPALTSGADNNGADLTVRIRANFGQGGFESIDHEDFFVKHPDDGCRVIVALNPPATAPESVTAEGTVKLRIVERTSQTLVPNAKSLLGQEINNAELASAGFQLKLEETKEKFGDDEFVSWRLEWVNASGTPQRLEEIAGGGGLGLQQPELVDASGNVIGTFSDTEYLAGVGAASLAWGMQVQPDQPIPDDAQLRFTINEEVSVVDVPFKVENVAVKEDSGF